MSNEALKHFTYLQGAAQAHCDKFAAEFAFDPANALSWSNEVFRRAAQLKVTKMMVYGFTPREGEPTCTVEQARKTCLDRVMNKARYPAQSTSPTSNLMEQFEAAAYAEALDYLNNL